MMLIFEPKELETNQLWYNNITGHKPDMKSENRTEPVKIVGQVFRAKPEEEPVTATSFRSVFFG